MNTPSDPSAAPPSDPMVDAKLQRRIDRRAAAEARWGGEVGGPWRRFTAWLNMLFVDHGVFRVVYLNLHRVADGAWRSAQPAPYQIRRMARRGVKTVASLRGGVLYGSYPLEREVCATAGLTFERIILRSRALPSVEEIGRIDTWLASAERPILFHCKSGADRAGMMAALYLILAEGRPVSEARRQLSLRFGHFRTGPTGVLDLFMDHAEAAERRGLSFRDWVATEYDRDGIMAAFKSDSLSAFVVDRLLRRE